MTLGELRFVDNPRSDLEAVVRQAARDYERKYGQAPNLALVHPSLLKGRPRRSLGRLRLESARNVLPNYVWIGMGGDAETMPLAQ